MANVSWSTIQNSIQEINALLTLDKDNKVNPLNYIKSGLLKITDAKLNENTTAVDTYTSRVILKSSIENGIIFNQDLIAIIVKQSAEKDIKKLEESLSRFGALDPNAPNQIQEELAELSQRSFPASPYLNNPFTILTTTIVTQASQEAGIIKTKLIQLKQDIAAYKSQIENNKATNTTPPSVGATSLNDVTSYKEQISDCRSSILRFNNLTRVDYDKLTFLLNTLINAKFTDSNAFEILNLVNPGSELYILITSYINALQTSDVVTSILAVTTLEIPNVAAAIPVYSVEEINRALECAGLIRFNLGNLANYYKQFAQNSKPSDIATATNKEGASNNNLSITSVEPQIGDVDYVQPEQWGIKFTIEGASYSKKSPTFFDAENPDVPKDNYYMTLLPARQSTIAMQGGRDTPNAMPGLNFKTTPLVGKQLIPGFQPVFQNLGVRSKVVTIVGCFTGADGEVNLTDIVDRGISPEEQFAKKGSATVWDNPGGRPVANQKDNVLANLSAYNSYLEFDRMMKEGKSLEVEINLHKVYNKVEVTKFANETKLQNPSNGNPRFTGIIRNLDVYYATKDRIWYTLVVEVSDFGLSSRKAINLNNKLDEAIKAAKAELEAANIKAANPSSPLADETSDNITNSNLSEEDKQKKRKILQHLATLSNRAVSDPNFLTPDGRSILQQIEGKDTFSYVQTIPLRNNGVLIKVSIGCKNIFKNRYINEESALLRGSILINLLARLTNAIGRTVIDPFTSTRIEQNNREAFTCETENYFHLTNTDEAIMEYVGEGTNQVKGEYYDAFPRNNNLEDLLDQKQQRLTGAEVGITVAEAAGCVAVDLVADALAGATIGAVTGSVVPVLGTTLGSIVGGAAAGISGLFITIPACSLGVGDALYRRYNEVSTEEDPDENDFWAQAAASFDLFEVMKNLGTSYLVSVAVPTVSGSVRRGVRKVIPAKQGLNAIGGNPLVNNNVDNFTSALRTQSSQNFTNALNKIPNAENLLKGQSIKVNNGSFIIDSVIKNADGTLTGDVIIKNATGQQTINLLSADALPSFIKTPSSSLGNIEINNLPPGAFNNSTGSITPTTPNFSLGQSINVKGNTQLANQALTNLIDGSSTGVNTPGLKLKLIDGGNIDVSSIRSLDNQSVVIVQPGDITGTKLSFTAIENITYPTTRPTSIISVSNTTPPLATNPPVAAASNTSITSLGLSPDATATLNALSSADQTKSIALIKEIQAGNVKDLQLTIGANKIGNSTSNPITTLSVTNEGKLLVNSSNGINSYSFEDVTYTKISPTVPTANINQSAPITTNVSRNVNTTPQSTLSSSTILQPLGLSTTGVKNFNTLLPIFNQQLARGKEATLIIQNRSPSSIFPTRRISKITLIENTKFKSVFVTVKGARQQILLEDIISITIP